MLKYIPIWFLHIFLSTNHWTIPFCCLHWDDQVTQETPFTPPTAPPPSPPMAPMPGPMGPMGPVGRTPARSRSEPPREVPWLLVMRHGRLENGPLISDFLIQSSIYMGFSIAMFDYQRVIMVSPQTLAVDVICILQ